MTIERSLVFCLVFLLYRKLHSTGMTRISDVQLLSNLMFKRSHTKSTHNCNQIQLPNEYRVIRKKIPQHQVQSVLIPIKPCMRIKNACTIFVIK